MITRHHEINTKMTFYCEKCLVSLVDHIPLFFSPRSDEVRNGDLWIALRPSVRACVRPCVRPDLYLGHPWADSFETLYIPRTLSGTYARAMIS